MATILPFVIPPRATPAAHSDGGCAEIVIFPGVRYETARSEDVDDRPPSSGTARKRKSAKTR
jgi:hypothetical protein